MSIGGVCAARVLGRRVSFRGMGDSATSSGHDRVRRIARTLADPEESSGVIAKQIAGAVQDRIADPAESSGATVKQIAGAVQHRIVERNYCG